MSEPNRIKKNAEVLCLLQASINLVSACTAIRAAGEMDAHVQIALAEVDKAIQRRLHGREVQK